MKKNEIKVGGLYTARVGGRYATVRVDAIRDQSGWQRDCTVYDVTNLDTGRKTTFRSAAKFRNEVTTTKQVVAGCPTCKSIPCVCEAEAEYDEETEQWVEGKKSPDPTLSTPTDIAIVEKPLTEIASEESAAQIVTTPAQAASTSSLAVKIAAQTTPKASGLTQQQQDILEVAKQIEAAREAGQRVLVIGAGAGTGKTFTLKQLEQVLYGNGQYTAFNSSLVAESKAKFQRAACNTTHSLAFRAVGRTFKHRLNGPRVRSYEVAAKLKISDFVVELPTSISPLDANGNPATRTLKATWLAGQVMEATRRFCQSADKSIGKKHFKLIAGIDEHGKYDNNDAVKDYLLPFAQTMWNDLNDPNGSLPFSHDTYVKIWELGEGKDRPMIAADYILLDEAQDTAPVMLSILQKQTHALLILVGDDNQQIYEWRGAVNAMASFPGAPRKLLSQSFRFGQTVADVANSILSTLEEPTDLVMSGLESIPTRVCKVAEPRCYLYRTNAGAIGRLMSAMAINKRGHLIGGTDETVAFCRAALDLQNGNTTNHPELGCFSKWAEVVEYSKEDEGADLRLMVKLIEDFGAKEIIVALDGMPKEEDADLVISTAHKSKGREWTSVKLGEDFPLANKLTDADRRLIYVAATRAQEELDITACPTFIGGYDKPVGDGENESAQASDWIPGLKITYTVAMPTAEDLAAYRLAKAASKPAKTASASSAITTTIQATEPVVANPIAPAGSPEFTWASLDAGWGIRGPIGRKPGEKVTVVKKSGQKSTVTLGAFVRKIGEFAIYKVG